MTRLNSQKTLKNNKKWPFLQNQFSKQIEERKVPFDFDYII